MIENVNGEDINPACLPPKDRRTLEMLLARLESVLNAEMRDRKGRPGKELSNSITNVVRLLAAAGAHVVKQGTRFAFPASDAGAYMVIKMDTGSCEYSVRLCACVLMCGCQLVCACVCVRVQTRCWWLAQAPWRGS